MSQEAAQHAYEMAATQSFGIITQVPPETFMAIIGKQEKPLVLQSAGGILFRKHYRYLTSYKGLTFFTKCYNSIKWEESVEIINVYYMRIPQESFKIY